MLTPKIEPNSFSDWKLVYQTSTDVDAQMVKNYLLDKEIECQILSKRDSAYNLNVGEMALVYLYVPNNQFDAAQNAINEWENGTIELDDDEPQ